MCFLPRLFPFSFPMCNVFTQVTLTSGMEVTVIIIEKVSPFLQK